MNTMVIERMPVNECAAAGTSRAIEAAPPMETVAPATREICSFGAMHRPDAALAAAQRLYAGNRSGLRFFCENRRVVPVDQLDRMDEADAVGAGQPRVRSTM